MGRPIGRENQAHKTPLEHTVSGFDKIAQPAYRTVSSGPPSRPRQPSSEGPSSSEAAPRRAKKEGSGAPAASPSSHGAAARRRLIDVAPVLSFLIPPPPPPPCASSFCLLPNAGTLARGGASRVLRQPASRGARAHRIREGDWAADPRRRRPHHPRGRGSRGQLMGRLVCIS